jgi:hypothetical protein
MKRFPNSNNYSFVFYERRKLETIDAIVKQVLIMVIVKFNHGIFINGNYLEDN